MTRLRLPHFIAAGTAALACGLLAVPAFAATSGTWTVTGSMNDARYLTATATVLPDGEVLEAGGQTSNLASAELYNPATGSWALTASMHTARDGQTATLLTNGQVLVAGGGSAATGSAELYNPATGAWTLTGNLTTNRYDATATLLANGEVLVAGGNAENGTYSALSSAELYNPATGTWTATGSLTTAREDQTATLLANGSVLVAGGLNSGANAIASAELYSPATGKWTATGSMSAAREGGNATLLPDDSVLVTAGIEGGTTGSPFGELYNPSTGQWSPAGTGAGEETCSSASDCRVFSTATLLGDGSVLIAGGLTGTASNPSSSVSALLYNPTANTWATTGSLNDARNHHTASLLPDGQVLVAGGEDFTHHAPTILASAELYNP